MSQVFISYRQTDDAQRKRVRAFAECLRDAGIDVILDSFFLDDNPGGPNEGWPKWSSDRASETAYVLIIGNQSWFQCFNGTQPPGTGLGAAREARDSRLAELAETLAREALSSSEQIGSQELIAAHSYSLARALVRQGRKAEALPYAQRSIEIFTRLGSPDLASARTILTECEG